jgi:hypothetical protein
MTRDHSLESQINLIFESLDWEKIHRIFEICEYTYAKNLIEDFNPQIEDLQSMSYNLLVECYNLGRKNKTNMILASGRFEAQWNNIDETLSLRFIPEEKEIMLDEENEAIYVA